MERIPAWPGLLALGLATLTAAMLAIAIPDARAATAADALPDLVADPPANPYLDYYSYSDGTHDLLLRFDGYIHNSGSGALEVRGSRATTADPMTVLQRVYRTDATYHDDTMPGTQLSYSNADGHHHWHLQEVARYSLWNQGRTAEVAPAMKVGFCLGDVGHPDAFGPSSAVYTFASFCQRNHPEVLSLSEGVSSGWRDVYDSGLTFQWVLASDVQPGSYWLREDIDPNGLVHESTETNPPAWSSSAFTIPGYVARAVTAPAAPYGQPQQVTLGADVHGSPGALRFRIVTPPAHGQLSVDTTTDFSDPAVVYTPATGYSGPDEFTYQATDSTSPYPIHPGTATVALTVGAPSPSVVIDSAPTSLEAGHGVQLDATVANDLPGVTWSVDGIDGGSADVGTITPSGFYTAPAGVPGSGSVTIGARSASGAHDERVVAVTWPPTPQPSPGTPDPGTPSGSLLSSLVTRRYGDVLVASVTPAHSGLVTIRARVGTRRLGSCVARTPRGRRFTCRLTVPHGRSLTQLKVVATLTRDRRVVATVHRTGAPPRPKGSSRGRLSAVALGR